jgi:DNA/RNA endonuclease G (NUC1)
VPTHYYKVVLAENSSGEHGDHRAAVGAFVMPNAPIDPQTPVSAYAVPLEALESVAGAHTGIIWGGGRGAKHVQITRVQHLQYML